MNTRILREVKYPESDGKPMAETPLHMRVTWDMIQTLIAWFASQPRVYVWGNMFLYFVPDDARKNISPDVMIIKDVDKDRERNFKTWEEGSSPCAIVEITSRKTRSEDQKKKFQLYQNVLKVNEYFLFDPYGEYLQPPLKGYRLANGIYQPIEAVAGRLPSVEMGLHLERHGKELRLWNPATGEWLPTQEEARLRDQDARILTEAENERLRREIEALRKKL